MYRDDRPRPPEANAPGLTADPLAPSGLAAHRGNRWWAAALLGYLLAMAACTALHALWPAAVLLLALLGSALARALFLRNRAESLFVGLNLVMVAVVLALLGPQTAIGLTLAIAQAVIGAIFLRSLAGPGPDLITRIACAVRAERSPRELRYARNVCRAWAIFMPALAVVSLIFTFAASERLWWAWKLFGSWALPVGFFCAEWLARQWILRREPKNGFRHALRALRHIDYPRLFEL